MPEIGGRRLAGSFKDLIAKAKTAVEQAHGELQSAIGEFSEQAEAAKQAAKQIRSEAAEMRASLGEVLGNEPPEEPGSGSDSGRG